MVSMSGVNFPAKTLRAQIASAINVVVQIARMEDGQRRMVSMQEINGMEGDIITMTELFKFERQGIDENGRVKGRYTATGIIPAFYDHLKNAALIFTTGYLMNFKLTGRYQATAVAGGVLCQSNI
ncbi:hypothetical protein [Aliamphritea spongicola]|nr:hypothetical protein [Aliamphritea spongicola]